MNDDTKERIEILIRALQSCHGTEAIPIVNRILDLECSDTSKSVEPPRLTPGSVHYAGENNIIGEMRVANKLTNAITFLVNELNDNKHYYECCNKILKNWDDYRKKYGL